MELKLTTYPITVHDPDLGLAFYRDVLGLELKNDVSNGDFRWIVLSPPDQPDIDIVLSQPHGGRSQEDGDAVMELLTKGALPGPFIFSTADLDATFEKIQASGAEVLQEPMDQGWGARDCAFRDPSGNTVRIAQAK